MKPKYDWLKIRNRWSGKLQRDCADMSEIEDLPTGWYLAFGEQMIDELNEILVKHKFDKKYRILQIKEKYGQLRWYDAGYPVAAEEEYNRWLSKYEDLSEVTCIVCGKPGKIDETRSWLMPLCEEHSNH